MLVLLQTRDRPCRCLQLLTCCLPTGPSKPDAGESPPKGPSLETNRREALEQHHIGTRSGPHKLTNCHSASRWVPYVCIILSILIQTMLPRRHFSTFASQAKLRVAIKLYRTRDVMRITAITEFVGQIFFSQRIQDSRENNFRLHCINSYGQSAVTNCLVNECVSPFMWSRRPRYDCRCYGSVTRSILLLK